MDVKNFNEMLRRFDYKGVTGDDFTGHASRALKKAAIRLIQDTSDPESVFLGTFFVDVKRVMDEKIFMAEFDMDGCQLVMLVNPYLVTYLDALNNKSLLYLIRHKITHLLLNHPQNLKLHAPGIDLNTARIGMDLTINMYFDNRLLRPDDSKLFCPSCMYLLNTCIDTAKFQANPECSVCLGSGNMALNMARVNAAQRRDKGGSLPFYNTVIGNYRLVARRVASELSPDRLDVSKPGNLLELTDRMVEYREKFQEAIVLSMANHAATQTKDFMKGSIEGSLLKEFSKLRGAKRVPYIMQIRGTIGASMKDEHAATRYRPNRRYGYDYPGTKTEPKQRYVLALDTSGSISAKEVRKIVDEFLNVSDYSDKIECRVMFFHHSVYFDKEIHEYKMSDLDKLQGGGTDFDKVLAAVYGSCKRRANTIDAEAVLIIYTDGHCSINYPRKNIKGQIIWLMTDSGYTTSYIKNWDQNAKILRTEKAR